MGWIYILIGVGVTAYFGRLMPLQGAQRQAAVNTQSGRRIAATEPGTVRAIAIGLVAVGVFLVVVGLVTIL